MAETGRTLGVYAVAAWMVLNLVLMALMIPHDSADLNNYLEVILWVCSIAGLLSGKRWGFAFGISVLGITLGTSLGNVLMAYYLSMLGETFAMVNALRIVVNAVAIAYLFRLIFNGKYR